MIDERGQIIINEGSVGFLFTYTNCLKNKQGNFLCQSCEFNTECLMIKDTNIDCSVCGADLEEDYVRIIKSLKEKNLLQDNFEPLCCECYDKLHTNLS